MSYLITGAAGFIGSHLCKALEERDMERYILADDFSRGKQSYLEYLGVKSHCQQSDLRDYDQAKVMTKNVGTVFHTACRIGGMQFLHGSPKNELRALQENIAIDNNICRACVENDVKKIIFTSSVSVYNTAKQYDKTAKPFKEKDKDEMRIDPEGGYGWAKFITEKNLEMMSDAGIKVGIVRIFKSYGPCDDYSPESGQVVLSLMRKILNHEKFIVWGKGNVTRNLVYIDDLIDAILKVEKYIERKSLTVNIGGNEPISIRKLAEQIVKLSEQRIKIQFDESKPSGPLSRVPNLNVAQNCLQWEPKTDLDTGLQKSWDWMKEEFK